MGGCRQLPPPAPPSLPPKPKAKKEQGHCVPVVCVMIRYCILASRSLAHHQSSSSSPQSDCSEKSSAFSFRGEGNREPSSGSARCRLVKKPPPHPAQITTESSGSMEPQRAEAEATGPGNDDDAACLCPAAVLAAAASPVAQHMFPRHALEQEVLHRADLQQLMQGGGDRRRERKMRNRESAARSRARRCAYASELEKEVSILRAEIEDLRKLCKQLKEAAEAPAPAKSSKKRPRGQLRRTSSASF